MREKRERERERERTREREKEKEKDRNSKSESKGERESGLTLPLQGKLWNKGTHLTAVLRSRELGPALSAPDGENLEDCEPLLVGRLACFRR